MFQENPSTTKVKIHEQNNSNYFMTLFSTSEHAKLNGYYSLALVESDNDVR